MEVRFVCQVCEREYVRQRDIRGKAPTVCRECQHENRHIYRKEGTRVYRGVGACKDCGTRILIATIGPPRKLCDHCRKRRKSEWSARNFQKPEVKERSRQAARRYQAKHKEKISAKRKQRHYEEKIRRAALAESKATGRPVDQILTQWGA